MVDAMNRLFVEALVQTSRGGPGGAALTPLGARVLADFRTHQRSLGAAAAPAGPLLAALRSRD
ncbi:MAG: ModE family transcriptional regulator, partial [Sandaracinobacteroides sp.]